MELRTEVEEDNFVKSPWPYRTNTEGLHAIHTLKTVCCPQIGTEGALNYRTHAIKGHRHYSKIMFWTLRLSHKNDLKNHF